MNRLYASFRPLRHRAFSELKIYRQLERSGIGTLKSEGSRAVHVLPRWLVPAGLPLLVQLPACRKSAQDLRVVGSPNSSKTCDQVIQVNNIVSWEFYALQCLTY